MILMHLQFTNYFRRLKKIMGDTYAFTIYNLQFTNYFCRLKKIMGDTYAFTIYNLQIIFANLKINVDDTNAFTITC